MTVTVNTPDTGSQYITDVADMLPGSAYLDKDGIVYICNCYDDVVACGFNGNSMIFVGSSLYYLKLREVDIEVTVTFK